MIETQVYRQMMTCRRLLRAAALGGLSVLAGAARGQTIDLLLPGALDRRDLTTALAQKGRMILQRTWLVYRELPRIAVLGYAMSALMLSTTGLAAAISPGSNYYTIYKNWGEAQEHCHGSDMVQADYDMRLRLLGYVCQWSHHRRLPPQFP